MEKSKDNIQFRILYFIGILMIVTNHCDGGSISLIYEWFPAYSFHNALFVFCSGYFFLKNRDTNFLDFFKKLLFKFIIPLYAWNLIYGLIILILHHFGFTFGKSLSFESLFLMPIYDGHQFTFNIPAWFIPTLLLVQFVNYFIIKLINNNHKLYICHFVISLLFGFLGISLAMKGYNQGWWLLLCRILYFIPFFSFGILYRTLLEKYDKLPNLLYFIMLFLMSIVIIYIFGGTKTYTPSWCNNFDNIFRPFIVGILGILFWLRISKILVPALKNSRLVNYISRNTYSIMIHHLFGFFVLNTLWFTLSKIFSFIDHFNVNMYKNYIYYIYLPKNLIQFRILYVIFGIGVSLIIAFTTSKLKLLIKSKLKKAKS